MNWGSALLWGFVATVALTSIESASRGLGFTRSSMPFLLGTMLTSSRDLANIFGIAFHMLNGWLAALLYAALFEATGGATSWLGALFGAIHAAFVLTVVLPLLPDIHPRMAREGEGPQSISLVQPPGFLGLHYGWATSIVTVVAHIVYGLILGLCYDSGSM
jgi:uncharacterized membrane protein YagU involved in acid resistance